MQSFDDPRWAEMKGGYKIAFDPRPLLKRLKSDQDMGPVWSELWDGLHHQGDIGDASFAAVPHIVSFYSSRGALDWNTYAIVAVIELARNQGGNSDVPEWVREDYFAAMDALADKGLSELPVAHDPELCRAILSVIALHKGLRNHARLLVEYSDEEMGKMEFAWKE